MLLNPTQAFMSIDAKTGVLTLTRRVDREQFDSVEVGIQVTDGVNPKTEWRRRVAVEDVNDNAPVFQLDGGDGQAFR